MVRIDSGRDVRPHHDPVQRHLQDGQERHRQQHRAHVEGGHSGIHFKSTRGSSFSFLVLTFKVLTISGL